MQLPAKVSKAHQGQALPAMLKVLDNLPSQKHLTTVILSLGLKCRTCGRYSDCMLVLAWLRQLI